MPHRTAARRPLLDGALPLRPRAGERRAFRLWTNRTARRAALPLALVLSAGAVGCQSAPRPLEALAGARDAVLSPNRPCEGADCGDAVVAKTAPDPFAATDAAFAKREAAFAKREVAADAVLADAGDAAGTPEFAAETPDAGGLKFADEFDATLAVLRDEATPFPSSDPADDPAAVAAAEGAAPDPAGLDPFAEVEALSESAPKADLASAPTGPGDLFHDAPVGPKDLFAGEHAEPRVRPTSLDQAFADTAAGPTAAPASAEPAAGGVEQTAAVQDASAESAATTAAATEAATEQATEEVDLVPPPWGPAAVAALAAEDPGEGFDPFAQADLTAEAERTAKAAREAERLRNAATANAAAALAAPMPRTLPAADPFAGPLVAPQSAAPQPTASVSANLGTLPSVAADAPAASPAPAVPVEALGPAPELSFGRPPLPPSFTDAAGEPAGDEAIDPSLLALAGPDDGLPAGEPRIAFSPQEPQFPETAVPAAELDPGLAALAAPEDGEDRDLGGHDGGDNEEVSAASAGSGRFAPTMPSSEAAVPNAPALAAEGEPALELRTAARPTARGEARLPGAVELDAPVMQPALGARTASPAAPLAAGLGVGCVLLVGLSLWRRRGGLL
ncbi:hypothetical protein [Alienimonas sp. DA493]|uniref:hypothetical protein n=1 Tax=Alienimonas sp. DA493 TaxID=3373605 RepID=UPI0037550BB9